MSATSLLLRLFIVAALLLPAVALGAASDEAYTRLAARILKDPTNIDLNLRFARLAEERGDLERALPAYERVTVNDPSNQEGQQGFLRVRRKLQPNATRINVELGGGYESNPRRDPSIRKPDAVGIANVDLKDERAVGDIRWRTTGTAIAEIYKQQSDMSYGYAGGMTGPVIDLSPKIALHPAIGGGASHFENHTFYREEIAAATLETSFFNAIQSFRFRTGYRKYGEEFLSSSGYYFDAIGRLVWADLIKRDDLFIVSPWYRWSGITSANGNVVTDAGVTGTGFRMLFEQVDPGRYYEWGGRIEYFYPLMNKVMIGGNVAVSGRWYSPALDPIVQTSSQRKDTFITPGASLIFTNVFDKPVDLRLDYRHETNRSNTETARFIDDMVTASAIYRF